MLLLAGRHNTERRDSAHMPIADRHEPDEDQLVPAIGCGDGPHAATYPDEAGRRKDPLADDHDMLHPSRDVDILAQALASLGDVAGSNPHHRDNYTVCPRVAAFLDGFVHYIDM